jgi:hypothetical protein
VRLAGRAGLPIRIGVGCLIGRTLRRGLGRGGGGGGLGRGGIVSDGGVYYPAVSDR